VFQKAIILAVSGYLPGCLISVGLYGLTRSATSLLLFMTLDRILQIFALTIVMCVSSGEIAVWKLRSADAADIF
jgi:putative ABC transport system permease protein